MKKRNIGKIAGLMAAVAILASPQAKASLDFTLGQANVPLTGPFGTVSVNLDNSTTATIILTALGSYSFGDGTTLGLNLADTGVTMSGLTLTKRPGATKDPSFKNIGTGIVDGWGDFNYQINTKDGFASSVIGLSFTLNKTSGTWGSEADILAANNKGFEVVGHVMNSNGSITGYAVVPEPTTMIAGALLLLPFGASALRILRKNRAA